MDSASLTPDSKTQYHSLVTPGPSHRKNRRHKKHQLLATSTPFDIKKIEQKSEQSSFLSCIENRLSRVLREIPVLKTSWTSIVSHFCSTFTELTTNLAKIQKKNTLPTDNDETKWTLEVCDMFGNPDLTEQARKLQQGKLLESSFDKLRTHLNSLDELCTEFANLITQLSAIYRLHQQDLDHWQQGGGDLSTLDDGSPISGLILWPALLGETQGLLNCLRKDLLIRTYLSQSLTAACTTKTSTLQIASLSWHLANLVNWNPLMEITQHLIDAFK